MVKPVENGEEVGSSQPTAAPRPPHLSGPTLVTETSSCALIRAQRMAISSLWRCLLFGAFWEACDGNGTNSKAASAKSCPHSVSF